MLIIALSHNWHSILRCTLLNAGLGQKLEELTFFNYDVAFFENYFLSTLLGPTTAVRHSSLVGSGNTKEKLAVSFLKLRYPSTYSLDDALEFSMVIPPGPGAKDYLRITNFDNANKDAWV